MLVTFKGGSIRIRLRRRRAFKILSRLVNAKHRGRPPFDHKDALPPQIHSPRRFPSRRLHALFLFHACYYMRGTIRSDDAVRLLAQLYRRKPDWFKPEYARTLKAETVTRALQSIGLGYQSKQIGRSWVINAERLHTRWRGNPLRMFQQIHSFEDALFHIQNKSGRGFFGFQEKMTSMLIYFYIDAGLIDSFDFPPPVDFHALRIMLAHEIMVPEDYRRPIYNKWVLAAIRGLLLDFCQTARISSNDLAESTWILSRVACQAHPGNTAVIDGVKDGRSTKFLPGAVVWDERTRRAYRETCGRCPIQRTCRRNVPALIYYTIGDLDASRRREKPPRRSTQPEDVPF